MPYTLSFKDRYLRVAESKVVSDTSESQQFYFIPDDIETFIRTKWTGKQWHKLLTCIETGADLMFPDEANEIIWQFIKTIVVPPEAPSQNECFEYLPSASFVKFYPDNPYIAGDNKDGWWNEAWYQWQDFFSLFPDWADDWIGGAVGGLLEYQDTDVLCNIASLAYPSWSAFFDAGGVFPKIEIKFSGTGQVNVSLLSFPLGGKAIIELDTEPNILDILTGGVLDPGAFMVELNRDIISFPPEEYPLIVIPIEVTTPGSHTLYINFIPLVNDETTFLGFGGGIRSIEMCGFAEVGEVGIEQIFWDGCALKIINGGIEETVVTAEEIQACMDIPDGSGGGAAAIKKTVYRKGIGASDYTTTSTTFVGVTGSTQEHTTTYPVIVLKAYNIGISNSGANDSEARPHINGQSPDLVATARMTGTSRMEMTGIVIYNDLTPGTYDLELLARSLSAGTTTIERDSQFVYEVEEYANIEDLFLQDVQYVDGVLQKKLAGVWYDVVDIEALLLPIETLAAAANTAAANAQTDADNAISTNSAQQTTINNHESRIDDLEAFQATTETNITNINTTLADHETRIDDLEESAVDGAIWSQEFDFTTGDQDWGGGDGYSSGNGFVIISSNNEITYALTTTQHDSKITHLEITCRKLSGSGFQTASIQWPIGSNAQNGRLPGTIGDAILNWAQVNPITVQYQPSLKIQFPTGHSYYLERLVVWGRGVNPWA